LIKVVRSDYFILFYPQGKIHPGMEDLRVRKRDGSLQFVKYDKVCKRLQSLCINHNIKCAYTLVAQKVIVGITDCIKTSALDELAAETAVYMSTRSLEFDRLASAVCVSNLHKNTLAHPTLLSYAEYAFELGLISPTYYGLVKQFGRDLEAQIKHERDYDYDYAAIKSIINIDLIKYQGVPIERPQWVHIRQALTFYGTVTETGFEVDMPAVLDLYEMLSRRICIHGTPTRISAGRTNNFSSCFLVVTRTQKGVEDNLTTLRDCGAITQANGGIGLSVGNIPASGTLQRNGRKNPGLTKFMKLCNDAAIYSEDEEKRRGGWAIYLEPWHADIQYAISVRRKSASPESACQRLFLAMWLCDLFMKRVEAKAMWSLFSPDTAPGLDDCWGEEFEALYTKYEREGRAIKQIEAHALWYHIIDCILDSGVPYIMFKDTCNRVSNQNHLGTIKASNLCTEIIQYATEDEMAVCNLASVNLLAVASDFGVDHLLLYRVVYRLARNLNKVIDLSEYPTRESRASNLRHRAIGIGFSGLADLFQKLRIPFTSARARELNLEIIETMYFAALRSSCDLAKELGTTYSSHPGSNLSKGIFQFDHYPGVTPSNRWNFLALRRDVGLYGTMNPLLIAPMPTSTCSVLCSVNESFEPYSDNIFTKRTVSGEYITVNKHLEKHLTELGLWDQDMVTEIVNNRGSIQNIERIDKSVREIYLTVWEIKMKDLADMAHDRQPYIDQGQSLSVFFSDPNRKILSDYLFYTWKKGLKNGMYYFRTKASISAANVMTHCDVCNV
jgi:ribonucleoside-diphosphate reductase alpha chain